MQIYNTTNEVGYKGGINNIEEGDILKKKTYSVGMNCHFFLHNLSSVVNRQYDVVNTSLIFMWMRGSVENVMRMQN